MGCDKPRLRRPSSCCRRSARLRLGRPAEPTEAELADVADAFALHPLAVEDALNAHQRPKLERYDDSLFLTLRTLWYVDEDDAVETGEINMFVGDDYVVTVRHGAGSELHTRRIDLEADTQVLLHGPSAVVYAVCDRVVDDYEAVACVAGGGRRRGGVLGVLTGPHQRLRPHLHPQARDRRDAPGRGPAQGADAAVRRGRGQGHRPRGAGRSSATSTTTWHARPRPSTGSTTC